MNHEATVKGSEGSETEKGILAKSGLAVEDGWSLPEQPETILLFTQLKALTGIRKEFRHLATVVYSRP